MKRILFLMLIFFAGRYAIRSLLEDERRERLVRLPATMMERFMEMMPEDSPPMVVMSSLRRMQEQNEEIAVLLREQNALLRTRLPA